jgi:7-cyano-7-deazaguanine synthase in queuosine biosynthesis
MDKLVTIVLFSGGIDSTGALYKLLKETDTPIVAHHINFVNRENRHTIESDVCSKIIPYLKSSVRDFEYNMSTFIFPFVHIGWDIINAMYIGGLIVKNYAMKYETVQLCIGDTKDDFGAYKWKSPIAQSVALIASLEDPRQPIQHTPVIIQPVVEMTKKQIIDYMPKELLEMTWSCRTPKIEKTDIGYTFVECGSCVTCADLKTNNIFHTKTVAVSKPVQQ